MRRFSLFVALGALVVSCAKDPETGGGSGGTPGTGGKTSTGGTTSSGGKTGSGGATSSGGKTGTGGSSSTQPTSVDCTDSANYSGFVGQQYGGAVIPVDGSSTSKSYYMQANWWGSPYSNQTEDIEGIGFTVNSPSSTPSSNPNNPLGFPSLFIGQYKDKRSTGSNLPKQVSALTSVPTIFSTNVNSFASQSFNATYDVWLTAGSGTVSGNDPGSGGAYLMVWLFKPTDKYPRGTLKGNGLVVNGVKGGWDVWYDPSTNNIPCVSYVASNKIESIEFDLKYFIQDAIDSKYGVTSSQYLSIIFAGFEIWAGGDGLKVNQFCANVK